MRLLDSSLTVLFVMCEIMRELVSFSIAHVFACSVQPSYPYTSREHTPVLYMRSFRLNGVNFDDQMCLISPAVG